MMSGLKAFLDRSINERLYLRPLVSVSGAVNHPDWVPLQGGPRGFTHVELIRRAAGERDTVVLRARDIESGAVPQVASIWRSLTHTLGNWAGLPLSQPVIMGIVNATPDSFSDGGHYFEAGRATDHGRALTAAGAQIIDVGGESTRPGAQPVDPEEEISRVVPVIKSLAAAGARISIDTRHVQVMAAALDAGALVVNDITALQNPEAAKLAAARGIPVMIMHMQGDPRTMRNAPAYTDAPLDIYDFLEARVAALEALSIPKNRIVLDPGIGFGKTALDNLAVLQQIGLLTGIGCGILVGASRKSFIARAANDGSAAQRRLGGSIAAALEAFSQGASIVRVHDVAETVQAVRTWQAIKRGGMSQVSGVQQDGA